MKRFEITFTSNRIEEPFVCIVDSENRDTAVSIAILSFISGINAKNSIHSISYWLKNKILIIEVEEI